MFGFISDSHNPTFNLATEELLLKHKSDDFLFLYIDTPSVIVGKHQNAYAETNNKALNSYNLSLYRRMSGGGTVYHDLGNLNFSFITTGEKGSLVDFDKYAQKIVDSINSLGLNTELGGRHDLLINKKKISGNASHVYKNRVMHHGTLLFNSDLSILGDSLKNDPSKYQDKSVKSVRSLVTNIANYLPKQITIDEFSNYILHSIVKPENSKFTLNDEDIKLIEELVVTKYSTWDWNYGYSPNYQFSKRIKILKLKLIIDISLLVKKGTIVDIAAKSNIHSDKLQDIFKSLINKKHHKQSIINTIEKDLKNLFQIDINLIIDQLF